MICLDDDTVLQLARGSLSGERRRDAETHVADCATCSERVRLADRTRTQLRWEDAPGEIAPPPSRVPPALPPGATVGRYIVLSLVGRGGMGDVYAAFDPELDRKVALKLLHEGRKDQRESRAVRLRREAKAIARLSHENVVAVFDAGTIDDRAFVAMEFVDGQTVAEWLRTTSPRPSWRRIVDVFLAAGRGLAAAHDAGLVHRDFKPANIMLRSDGGVRVTDFGLARWLDGPDGEAAPAAADPGAAADGPSASGGGIEGGLTRTGSLMGTPAYMSPEQLQGDPVDARSDQFSYCVSLYQALYGERPFGGDNVSTLWLGVTSGDVRPAPKDRNVPGWIRRLLIRGMAAKAKDRFPSMAALIAALKNDPAVRRRRLLLAGAGMGLAIAAAVAVQQAGSHRRQALERQIGARMEEAAAALATGRTKAAALRERRSRSFAAFDAMDSQQGEALWRDASALRPAVDAAFDHAGQAYEAVLVLDPARAAARTAAAAALYEQLLVAEELRQPDRVRALGARLDRHDRDGARRAALSAPGVLVARISPAGATATLERFEIDVPTGRRVPRTVGTLLPAAPPRELAPGSYRLIARAEGHADVAHPFEIARSQRVTVDVDVPPSQAVPAGMIHVPAGESWFGDADEALRTQFLNTVPIHRRRVDAFLIARHETTYAEWIAFLDDLPAAERPKYTPGRSQGIHGFLSLQRTGTSWQLTLQPMTRRQTARAGEDFVYAGRSRRARQDWLHFPVAAVSTPQIERYLSWLDGTGRVPGARFCTDLEWERAARGADDRSFPHGDILAPDDANFDATYGQVDAAFGPDIVGSHPASRSPFGVDDLAGNVLELVRSSLRPHDMALRSGAYFYSPMTARSTNREVVPASFRDIRAGVRVCASITPGR